MHDMRVLRGPVVTEVHQIFSDYTSAVIRSAFQMIIWVFYAILFSDFVSFLPQLCRPL